LPADKVIKGNIPLGVDANLNAFPFETNAPRTAQQRRIKKNGTWKLLSRRQQPSNGRRGPNPRHAPRLTALESQHRLTKLTQYATYESKKQILFLKAKGHSAQPGMFWRALHTNPDPTTKEVMPLGL
jgi:hypothetical protein